MVNRPDGNRQHSSYSSGLTPQLLLPYVDTRPTAINLPTVQRGAALDTRLNSIGGVAKP
jgi:hypothetical protein